MNRKILAGAGAISAAFAAVPALAADLVKAPADPAVLAAMTNKGDTSWMLIS